MQPRGWLKEGAASMRPRHKAAENEERYALRSLYRKASMRPRHKAAENTGRPVRTGGKRQGFNEAAA